MKTALVALTAKGRATAQRIKDMLPHAELYLAERVADGSEQKIIKNNLSGLMGELFAEYTHIICVCAVGIVVRAAAPHLKHKSIDPAVVVVDDGGKFAISLLSGHLGGANQLAKEIADMLGAQAVITTASDNLGIISAEQWGKEYKLTLEDFTYLPAINAALVNGEALAVISDWEVPAHAQVLGSPGKVDYYSFQAINSIKNNYSGFIYITDKIISHMLQPCIILRPKTLVAGIGVRRGVPKEVIRQVLEDVLKEAGVSLLSLQLLASIDAKEDEKGLLELAQELNLSIKFFSKDILNTIISAKQLEISDFVERQMGVGAVCEPAALAVAKNSTLIMNKVRAQGVTIAIARVPFTW